MKKILFPTAIMMAFLLHAAETACQEYHPPYEEEYLGWIKIYKFKGVTKPVQVDEKKYSTAQLSIADSFANWIQASYLPKGGLGDIKKYVTPKINLYHEKYNAGLPHSYGANARTYIFLKKSNGKWIPENNLGYGWTIAANEIPLDYRLADLNTANACYFTIPGYDDKLIREQPGTDEAKTKKMYDLSAHPVLGKYIQYNIPGYNNTHRMNVVVLSRNNRPPFIPVTIGQTLQAAADAFPLKYAEEKKTVFEQNSYDARHLELATRTLNEKFDKARATLERLREKYSTRLNEPASSTYGGYSIQSLTNGYDIFTARKVEEGGSFDLSFPILRVDPALQALCKTDKPQWIVVKWFGGSLTQPSFKHMHESVINNFDFDYLYQFFFDPEKVRGRGYKPLQSLMKEEKTVLLESSGETRKNETDPAVFFFDDFSASVPGQKPNGWKSEMNSDARPATVSTVNGETGKWMEIKGNYFVYPQQMKLPLPSNFELSFDLAVPKDIPWGAKALELFLCTQNKLNENDGFLKIRFRAGFYGRPGEIAVQTKFGASYSSNKTDYPGTGFSNDKTFNKVRVKLKKQGESLMLFFDNNRIADLPNSLPASTLFNWFQFKHLNSSSDTEKYFIGNFKIVRQ